MLNPHLLLWLGLASVLLAGVGQTLKSDTFDAFLAFFGARPLPKVWVPRVTVLVGVLAAVVTGVTSGASLEVAVTQAIAVGFGSILAIAVHELVARKNTGEPAADTIAPRSGSAGGGAAGAALLILSVGVLGRLLFGIVAPLVLVLGVAAAASNCTPEAKSAVDKGLDSAPLVCAATLEVEQLLNLDDSATKTVCHVVEETEPAVKKAFDEIVGAKKAQARKLAASGAHPCK